MLHFLLSFLFPATKQDTTNCWKQENLCALGTSQIAFKVTNVAGFTVRYGMGRLTKKRSQQTRAKNISSANKPKCQLTSVSSIRISFSTGSGHFSCFGLWSVACCFYFFFSYAHTYSSPGGVALDDPALEFIAVSTWKSAVFSLGGFLFSALAFVQKLSPYRHKRVVRGKRARGI